MSGGRAPPEVGRKGASRGRDGGRLKRSVGRVPSEVERAPPKVCREDASRGMCGRAHLEVRRWMKICVNINMFVQKAV